MDPNPDYDASDELEYGVNWFAWILRGVYPPPAYPPDKPVHREQTHKRAPELLGARFCVCSRFSGGIRRLRP